MPEADTSNDEYKVKASGDGVAVGRNATAKVEGDATQAEILRNVMELIGIVVPLKYLPDEVKEIRKDIAELVPVMKEIKDIKSDNQKQWRIIKQNRNVAIAGIILGVLALVGLVALFVLAFWLGG